MSFSMEKGRQEGPALLQAVPAGRSAAGLGAGALEGCSESASAVGGKGTGAPADSPVLAAGHPERAPFGPQDPFL